MAVMYCIFCKHHKEALRLGSSFEPILGNPLSENECELAEDAIQKMRAYLESTADIEEKARREYDGVLSQIDEFMRKHRECKLSACDNMFDYVWSIPAEVRKKIPRLIHLPGWIIRDANVRGGEKPGREQLKV